MSKRGKRKVKRRTVRIEELAAILERAESALAAEDVSTLRAAVDTLALLTQELEAKGASVRRLRKLVFGSSTEKTSKVVGAASPGSDDTDEGAAASGEGGTSKRSRAPKKSKKKGKPKGHGRNGADAYTGADKVAVPHATLSHKDRCPCCDKGKVYHQREPAVIIRVQGMAPLQATLYERERLRCNLCGEVFTADSPPGVGEDKYDETAAAMVALLKYGCGMPFNRLERLEGSLGIPLPAATQWEIVRDAAELLEPAFEELVRQAAQGQVVHNDDTTMRILDQDRHALEEAVAEDEGNKRTGTFTSGIVSILGEHRIALFFTGQQHAGENLADVLANRAADLPPPIQMCDALSHNTAGDFTTIVASCMAHGRRKFVDVAPSFPEECKHVLEELREIYRFDDEARALGLSPDERLRFHQDNSKPVMDALQAWLNAQIEERKIEPNSGLGDAIGYMLKHWSKLTLFLREPGAPLDNNICERVLKKAILHRKNAYFYKTDNGARVGDLFMTLIHTAELCGADPFGYLVALQRHAPAVRTGPADWLPWNYADTVARLDASSDPRLE
jgi:transposase